MGDNFDHELRYDPEQTTKQIPYVNKNKKMSKEEANDLIYKDSTFNYFFNYTSYYKKLCYEEQNKVQLVLAMRGVQILLGGRLMYTDGEIYGYGSRNVYLKY